MSLPSSRTRRLVLAGLLICLTARCLAARAQEDEEPEWRPGLVGHYTASTAAAPPFARVDEKLSFVWDQASPDRRLPDGPFQVRWAGRLWTQIPGRHRFFVHAAGEFTLRLGERTLLAGSSEAPQWFSSDPVELPYDYHPLEIEYRNTSPRARLALFWEGPQFLLEPISERFLVHAPEESPADLFPRGQTLVRALRCAACHDMAGEPSALPAPALDALSGHLALDWLTRWLHEGEVAPSHSEEDFGRRMPAFDLTQDEAQALSAWLLSERHTAAASEAPPARQPAPPADRPAKPKAGGKKSEAPPPDPVAAGEQLFLTTGCLACHRMGDLGSNGPFGGGDLSQIGAKRPRDFFRRWLTEPAALNARHRMPLFAWTDLQREDLAAYLASRGAPAAAPAVPQAPDTKRRAGRELFAELQCGACHLRATGDPPPSTRRTRLHAGSAWESGCLGAASRENRRPGFQLQAADQAAVRAYITQLAARDPDSSRLSGQQLLTERNCLACHARHAAPGLGKSLPSLAEAHPELAEVLSALAPPSLNDVGDKLNDEALASAIRREGPSRRPWLQIQMPRFAFEPQEVAALAAFFVERDRLPESPPAGIAPVAIQDPQAVELAGQRLVTSDGFGCTSCHQIGSSLPSKAPLSALGPDLSEMGKRIRRSWFDRWVRNPARMIPRMEMPSVQIPVRGVLEERLDLQLAAVWTVFNRPGFEPPAPHPVRVVRRSGLLARGERALFLSDVLRVGSETHIKPFLVALPNRHNVLWNLDTGRLEGWWIGDAARQRTEGKSWYWESAGVDLLPSASDEADIHLVRRDEALAPRRHGQFITEMDEVLHGEQGLSLRHRLHFTLDDNSPVSVEVSQSVQPLGDATAPGPTGFRRELRIRDVPPDCQVQLDVGIVTRSSTGRLDALPSDLALADDGRRIEYRGARPYQIQIVSPANARFNPQGRIVLTAGGTPRSVALTLAYHTPLPLDSFPLELPEDPPVRPEKLAIVPGFEAVRLPLGEAEMPTGLTWLPDGRLAFSSLKGQVWLTDDRDGDGLADQARAYSDELAAPYGLAAGEGYIDVINKYALLRLYDDDRDGVADRTRTLASGWGHTADYHDWAVGLEPGAGGSYWIGLPCQQDQRSPAAAQLRGTVLKLLPRPDSSTDTPSFALEVISRGHRFPMGLATHRDGALFVTDNQGNYNPFNELNHVRPGAHFGFINSLERQGDARPPLAPPAINIPHPWTRSVNGICFLNTPAGLPPAFGPFEGQLIGCEYDTRRLIRMSVQRVGNTYQGAAYPFSWETPPEGPALLGPLVCRVSPKAELYVGSIRDSGWGAGNNIGELVRLRPKFETLPVGIAEMTAIPGGFRIRFTKPVAASLATDPQRYTLTSYTRVSTPAYGGSDQDRRTEKLSQVRLLEEGQTVELTLPELREGFVYELRVQPLVAAGEPFFPAEAHYTLLREFDK